MRSRIPKIRQAKIEHWRKFKDNSRDNANYAAGRFDIMIVSLSSGGIAAGLSFYNSLKESHTCLCDTILFKLSVIAFCISIAVNLISQIATLYSNIWLIKHAQNKLRQYEFFENNKSTAKWKEKSDKLELVNEVANWASLLFLLLGLVLFIIFAWNKI